MSMAEEMKSLEWQLAHELSCGKSLSDGIWKKCRQCLQY